MDALSKVVNAASHKLVAYQVSASRADRQQHGLEAAPSTSSRRSADRVRHPISSKNQRRQTARHSPADRITGRVQKFVDSAAGGLL